MFSQHAKFLSRALDAQFRGRAAAGCWASPFLLPFPDLLPAPAEDPHCACGPNLIARRYRSAGQVTLPRRHTAEDPELLQGFKWLSLARAAFMSLSADFESVTLSVRSKNHTRVGTRKITRSISPLASRPLQGVRSATQRQRWAVDLLTPLQPPQKPCSALQKASLRVAEVVPGGRGGPCCVENCMTCCT